MNTPFSAGYPPLLALNSPSSSTQPSWFPVREHNRRFCHAPPRPHGRSPIGTHNNGLPFFRHSQWPWTALDILRIRFLLWKKSPSGCACVKQLHPGKPKLLKGAAHRLAARAVDGVYTIFISRQAAIVFLSIRGSTASKIRIVQILPQAVSAPGSRRYQNPCSLCRNSFRTFLCAKAYPPPVQGKLRSVLTVNLIAVILAPWDCGLPLSLFRQRHDNAAPQRKAAARAAARCKDSCAHRDMPVSGRQGRQTPGFCDGIIAYGHSVLLLFAGAYISRKPQSGSAHGIFVHSVAAKTQYPAHTGRAELKLGIKRSFFSCSLKESSPASAEGSHFQPNAHTPFYNPFFRFLSGSRDPFCCVAAVSDGLKS